MPAYRASQFSRSTYSRGNSSNAWARNRNAVRHAPKVMLGPISHTITVILIVLLVGLIFLTQSAKVTDYDAAIAGIDTEIANLEMQRDALKVENAKITASAADEDRNEVAATMANASAADFVKE